MKTLRNIHPAPSAWTIAVLTICGSVAAHAQDSRFGGQAPRLEPAAAPVTLPVAPSVAPSVTQSVTPSVAQPAGPLAQAEAQAASGVRLVNLTTQNANVEAGHRLCPNQPYYLYSGGKPDGFAGPADPAYPSTNLTAMIPAGGATVAYDVPMVDGRFGDSFNLQHTRGICHAVVQFRAKASNGGAANDGLTIGHVVNNSPFAIVAQVINPGSTTAVQSYALDATGLGNLSAQTGWGMNKTRDQSVLDVYLQDDTQLDFFRVFVWYGPNCTQSGKGKESPC